MKKANVSRLFLLPGLQLDERVRQEFSRFGFVNTYLTCDQLSYAFNVIFLLFKPSDLDLEFYTFSKNMERNPNFIEAIDLGSNKVVLIYRIPKRFTADYELFLDGKYSKLSKAFQSCFAMEDIVRDDNGTPIKKEGKYIKEPSRFFHIFNRTDWMKEHWKLKLYGETNADGKVGFSSFKNEYDAHIIDEIELYQKQDPVDEFLNIGMSIW